MSPSRPTTRAKNKNMHPGDVIPKQARRSKKEMEAAREAEKAAKKKKEVERERKLTNIAQAEDKIACDMQAEEASVPRARPKRTLKPLKRTYAMLNVLEESKKENQLGMESDAGEQSDDYVPSGSEPIDPASESDTQSHNDAVEPPKKKRGKKASVLQEIQARRQHLDPILEENSELEVEEEDKDDLMGDINEFPQSHGTHTEASQGSLPFKAGLKKTWLAQKNATVNPKTALAPKASKKGSRVADPMSTNSAPVATKQSSRDFQSVHESVATAPRPKVGNPAKSSKPAKLSADIETFQTQVHAKPYPRPRPVSKPKVSLARQAEAPETPLASTARQGVPVLPSLQATPVNVGAGIPEPEEESDTEEYVAAKSSPIKAGVRVTSNAIVAIQPAGQASTAGVRKAFPAPKAAANQAVGLEREPSNDRASVAPSEQSGHARQLRGAGHTQSATYDSLPSTVSRQTFKEVYMPTVVKYLARLPDVWSTTTKDYIRIIQSVWNEVFPGVPYAFTTTSRCDLTRLITQRTYEWRGRFASAAIDAVLDLEASDDAFQDPDIRKEWVMWATQEGVWPFLYEETESKNPDDWTGTFGSPLITQTLATHVAFTAKATNIEQLEDLETRPPAGALALVTVAVERALNVWHDGGLHNWGQLRDKERPSPPKFDYSTWGKKTEAWLGSINTLTDDSWDVIINLAHEHIKPTSRKPLPTRVEENMDNRAILVARPMRK